MFKPNLYRAWIRARERDIQSEIVWWYCPKCEEEYRFPEDIEECPICNSHDIELV